MKRFGLLLALLLCACDGLAVAQDLWVYDNGLAGGFEDWGWASRDFAYAGQFHSAPVALRWQPDGWAGIYLHNGAHFDVVDYLSLRFWVRGEGSGGQQLRVAIWLDGGERASADLDDYLSAGGISSSEWREAVLPFAALGLAAGSFNELIFQDTTGGDQSAVLLDDIRFVADLTPPGPVAVLVDPALDRRPVSDLIYGVNFASAEQLAAVGYTVNRWGGNRTTRYNWLLDVDNSAFDWFFQNYAGDGDPGQLPAGSGADQFLLATRAADVEAVLTLPLLGRVAGPDRERRWSFSQALYGPQLQDECSYFGANPPPWCNPDAGNGQCDPAVNTSGYCSVDGEIVGNDPDDTSLPVAASFVTGWLDFVATRIGPPATGGLRFAALDNEPMLWNSTHRDLHPAPATYDELWSRTATLAAAVKAAAPDLALLGPDTWGWCDLWTSAADAAAGPSCLDGADRQAHGGLPFVAWYLEQVCDQLATTGVRLVDYLDVHYYPQSGEAFGGEGYAALRLRSIRELWDPTYTSQSWIGDEVALVPRLEGWIAAHCPGTRLALTEYSWGADEAPSGALAQAELLAILGREGVDLATRWVVPASGSKTEEAFRLFLRYDGAARVLGESVRATTSDVDAVGAYALRGHADELFVLLFNKDDEAREVGVTLVGPTAGSFALHRFTASTPLGSAGSATPAGGVLSLTLPARSATLAVGRVTSDLVFADRFEGGTTLAWSSAVP